jgi:dUTP pyrophosphatase
VVVPVRRLDADVPLPSAQHPGDAGYDLHARVDVAIAPGARALVPTGFSMALPPGYAGFVQPRSGLALKHGITVLNAPGLVDAGYRDEIKVLLVNLDATETFVIHRGDRIAQLVVQAVVEVHWAEVDELEGSRRGTGGFGSTGVAT